MQTQQLDPGKYTSRVLGQWLESRQGMSRAGIKAVLPENSAVSNLNADQLAQLLGASVSSAAGSVVTPETALRQSTVYACVSLIAGAISTLPIGIYERTENTRKAAKHDYWWMLNEQAFSEMSTSTAMEYFVASRLFYGDAFGLLIRPSQYTNRVIGWEPIHPMRVQPFRDFEDPARPIYYRVTDAAGGVKVYDKADILHVPSLGFDGLRSPSPITYAAREAIGTALAAEEYSARFYSQGSTYDIALKTKSTLGEEQANQLRASYVARQGGGKNNRIPLILTGGLEVEKLSITPADAALLPTRQFGVEEICRIFGVPPYMAGATVNSTSFGTGIEQQGIGFVKYTLRRHLTPIEQELNRKLWPNRERYFAEYDTASLERGDFKTRMEGYRTAIGRAGEPGWISPNEVRNRENMEPIEGGDAIVQGILPTPKEPNEKQTA